MRCSKAAALLCFLVMKTSKDTNSFGGSHRDSLTKGVTYKAASPRLRRKVLAGWIALASGVLLVVTSGVDTRASPSEKPAPTEPAETILSATDTAALREKIGQTVVVEGRVQRVGRSPEGGITFLNFGGRGSGALVGVIFKRSYAAFPDGFDHYENRLMRVEGPLSLYENATPQIVIEHPSQIHLLD